MKNTTLIHTVKSAPDALKNHFPVINGIVHNPDGSEITMAQWLGVPPEITEIEQIIETDVLVVGGGLAGVSAARAAVESGARVVLLEKMNAIQGRSGDFAIMGSSFEKRWNRDTTKYRDKIINSFMKDLGWRTNYRIMRYWADHCGETFDWYMSAKPDVFIQNATLEPLPTDVKCWLRPQRFPAPAEWDVEEEYVPCWPVTSRLYPTHMPVTHKNLDIAEQTGLCSVYYNSPAVKLLREEQGKMTGAIAYDIKKDEYFQVNAGAVVLTTGSFEGNPEMLYYYCPWSRHSWVMTNPNVKYRYNTGDGHIMGMWIGAQMEDGPLGTVDHSLGGTLACSAFLLLNADGERFMNEDTGGQNWQNALVRQREARAFQIFDWNWPEQVSHLGVAHAAVMGVLPDIPYEHPTQRATFEPGDCFTDRETVQAEVDAGKCLMADTLDDLVKLMYDDPESQERALLEINRYNELCALGKDLDFGKKGERMMPISQPPFYASPVDSARIIFTVGGLDADHNCRVLDENKRPIPGLYAAGNVQGGRFAVEYPMTIPGLSHSMCITFGRLAGTLAASYTKEVI